MRWFLAVLALCLVAAAPAVAAADPIVTLSSKTAMPVVTETLHVTARAGVYLDSLGFTCPGGGGNTDKTPAATFKLTDDLADLRLRLARGKYDAQIGAVVQFPGGKYACEDDHDEFFFKTWPKGDYTIYFYGNSTDLAAELHFEIPASSKQAVDDELAHLGTIKLGPEGANGGANPAFVEVAVGKGAEAGDLGIGCGTDARDVLVPIAKLEVSKQSSYFVEVGSLDTFVITDDNKCATKGEMTLAPGTHTLWAVAPAAGMPAKVTVEADDRDRALGFGDAPRKTATDLAEPMIIDGTVRAAQAWPTRNPCSGTARAPDFYLTTDAPLQKVELSILWSKKRQELHVFGPLAKMTNQWEVDCHDETERHDFDVLDGTYAVWVGSGDADATGDTFHVMVRRTDVALDPLKTLAPIPSELTLAERAYPHFYPFFEGKRETDWKAIFTGAPDQLFVYARVATGDDRAEVAAGEPLLVDWATGDAAEVRTWNGRQTRVAIDLLTTDKPQAIALPKSAPADAISDLSPAVDQAGPEDKKAIDAYFTQKQKLDDCEYRYLKAHDPTWGTDDNLYRISASGHITNVGAAVGKAADRKCGAAKLDKAEKALLKKLAKTRAVRWQAHLAAVRKRFGLD